MIGYKFNTEQEARSAKQKVNNYYGIPASETSTTTTWCRYVVLEKFCYIVYDDSLLEVLGEPSEFEVPSANI